jgi:hypothetical protein
MKLKLRRNSIMPLLIIVFVCLVLLPIIAYYMDNIMEGFTTSSIKFTPRAIDRILFSKGTTDRNYKNSDGTLLDMSGQYGYCLGGNIKCSGADLVKISDSYLYGTTYSSLCNDGQSMPICNDNHYGTDIMDASMENNINIIDTIFKTTGWGEGGINILDPTNFRGFVGPYSQYKPDTTTPYYPFILDSTNSKVINYKFFDSAKSLKQSSNKQVCDLVSDYYRPYCNDYYYDLDNNDNGYGNGSGSGSGSGDGSDDSSSSDDKDLDGYTEDDSNYGNANGDDSTCGSKIPCIADFGTNVGDKLCCGQTGVLQNTKYVCPANAPKCSSFKCGSKFGTCGTA